jgi:hypothetical protein
MRNCIFERVLCVTFGVLMSVGAMIVFSACDAV